MYLFESLVLFKDTMCFHKSVLCRVRQFTKEVKTFGIKLRSRKGHEPHGFYNYRFLSKRKNTSLRPKVKYMVTKSQDLKRTCSRSHQPIHLFRISLLI